jgi:hypothetical protein
MQDEWGASYWTYDLLGRPTGRARGQVEKVCGQTRKLPAKHDNHAGRLSVAFRPGARSVPRPCMHPAEAMVDRRLWLRSQAQRYPRLGEALFHLLVRAPRPHGAPR